MKLKPDWHTWLHELRRREVDLLFGRFEDGAFEDGLELGAGDGFQSRLLTRWVKRLTATDITPGRWRGPADVRFLTCDAERIDESFDREAFDLVFSSNLLEHLPAPEAALRGIHHVLRDDGLGLHLVPSPFWKLGHVLLHVPNLAVTTLERLSEPTPEPMERSTRQTNNPKTLRPRRSLVAKIFSPLPHGVSRTHLEEFAAFSRRRWLQRFRETGFDVLRVLKGPIGSGYGFGCDRLRTALERLGFTSVYVYVTCKHGHQPRSVQAWFDGVPPGTDTRRRELPIP